MAGGPRESGARLLRERVESIPALLREFEAWPLPTLAFDFFDFFDSGSSLPRAWVVSGIGSSAGHARFLAHLLSERVGLTARFVSTGSLAAGPPRGSEGDALIVFSQGLSPNARFALANTARWSRVVLVTAVRPDPVAREDSAERFLARCQEQGVSIVPLPDAARNEYQTLVRVVGPALGYAVSISLARALAGRVYGDTSRVDALLPLVDASQLSGAVESAASAVAGVFPADRSVSSVLARETVLLTTGGYGELVQNLRSKLLEGMGLAEPALFDLLEFAHGGFQRIYGRKATLIALTASDQSELESRQLEGLRQLLHPARHDLRVLHAALPRPWSVFEHEAAFNELMLRFIEERGRDPRRWPGRGRDAPLYQLTPLTPPDSGSLPRPSTQSSVDPNPDEGEAEGVSRWSSLGERTWPEIEEALASGRRTAVIPLGSTEQHGPHLPFATDSWIAEALARGFCARVPEAIRLPTVSLGCASEHLGFPGTLSLSAESLDGVVGDLLASLSSHGFERAFVFSAHGGNFAVLRGMQEKLGERAHSLRVIVFSDLASLVERWHRASEGFGVSPEQSGHHAGEFETSIIAALRPGAVRHSQLAEGVVEGVTDAQRLFYPSLRENAANGVVGDPRGARAERGRVYLESWIEALVECYRADGAAGADSAAR